MGATQAQCKRGDRAGPYVLGELDPRTRLAYERHLRVCGRCRVEVELLLNAADALPLLSATPQTSDQAKPAVEAKPLLQAIPGGAAAPPAPVQRPIAASAPPVAPLRPRTDEAELRRAVQRRRQETAALRSGLTPSAAHLMGGRGQRRPPLKVRFLRKPVPGPAVVGFAAVAVVAVLTIALSSRVAGIRYERAQAGWKPGGAAIGTDGNQLELLVEKMARPPLGTGYQVWVLAKAAHAMVPTRAWLEPNRAGDAGVTVPGNYHNWAAIAVYVERLRGPESERSGAVVVADLRHVA